jgi:hypothetical protein|tara:strand:- start:197 stop:478 length:282 start_codon:yes stop_codon:yes gene_type:complete
MNSMNGLDTKGVIVISVYPSKEGFMCTLTEPKQMPLTADYSIALTIAHGMIRMALERPDIIFDEGINALANPRDNDNVINVNDMAKLKKDKLH